jgi:hypothetical protein
MTLQQGLSGARFRKLKGRVQASNPFSHYFK